MNNQTVKAELTVLYSMEPNRPGERFVEVRHWQTVDKAHEELILEHGYLDDSGELTTHCLIMPFYMTLEQVLESLGQIRALPVRKPALIA